MIKRKLEDMSVEELQKELQEVNKKSGFSPQKLKSDINGTILLDRNNKEHVDWYQNESDDNYNA